MKKIQTVVHCRGHQARVASSPCLHLLTGKVQAAKTCILNYECRHCGFDQWLDTLEGMDARSTDRRPASA